MIAMISSPCEAAREQADACHHDPRLGAGDTRLEVLGEATVASKPSEGAFDHTSSRLSLEGSEGLGSSDNLDRPATQVGDCIQQLWSAIDAIGEDMAQLGKHSSDGSQHWSLQLLRHVKSTRAAAFRGLYALAVDDCG